MIENVEGEQRALLDQVRRRHGCLLSSNITRGVPGESSKTLEHSFASLVYLKVSHSPLFDLRAPDDDSKSYQRANAHRDP